MDKCVRQLVIIKKFIDAIPQTSWDIPPETVLDDMFLLFKIETSELVTVGNLSK